MVALSVIIPAYNEAASIRDAIADVIRHVLAAVPDSEVIVVDDGSTDATARIVDEIAARPCCAGFHRPAAMPFWCSTGTGRSRLMPLPAIGVLFQARRLAALLGAGIAHSDGNVSFEAGVGVHATEDGYDGFDGVLRVLFRF